MMIEARHLTKRYGQIVAVDDACFAVRPGRVTGFLGPNGAGKSTTLEEAFFDLTPRRNRLPRHPADRRDDRTLT
jgi:ABC-type multidrug transport system ATPase subunit